MTFKLPETTAWLLTLLSLALTCYPLGCYPSNFFALVDIVLGISFVFRWPQTIKIANQWSYSIHGRWHAQVAHIEGEFPVVILPERLWYGWTLWHWFYSLTNVTASIYTKTCNFFWNRGYNHQQLSVWQCFLASDNDCHKWHATRGAFFPNLIGPTLTGLAQGMEAIPPAGWPNGIGDELPFGI